MPRSALRSRVDADRCIRLPELVQRYLERALAAGANRAQQVLITQTGEMFRKPRARALHFTATERFAVDRIAFSWEARFPIAPLISLEVHDGYEHGRGVLRVRALGLPVQTQSGRDVDVGEVYRYLAELPWAPQAMAQNPALDWREVDERIVEVTVKLDDEQPRVRFEFDDAGEIVRCVADSRPGTVMGRSLSAPWGGDFSEYKTLGGIRMPTRGEVYWELPQRRFVYWRGEISSAHALAEPYQSHGVEP